MIKYNLSLLAVLLVLLLTTSNLLAVNGDMGGVTQDGSAEAPYLIEDFNDFQVFANDPNYWDDGIYTRLDCDIDLDPNLPGRQVYITAVIDSVFNGHFDGNGRVISNITIDTEGADNDYLGLFGRISLSASISNLGIKNINISGGENSIFLGGLCGSNGKLDYYGGIITNCYANGVITGGNNSYSLGGLCGGNFGSITECHFNGDIYGKADLGGLCGGNFGWITNCHADGYINGIDSSRNLGGLCGLNFGTIDDCYSNSFITGYKCIGGLCGSSFDTITNSHATGAVKGGENSSSIGGLCGYNLWPDSKIINCYAVGPVNGNYDLGGLCGENEEGSINNCYAVGPVNGESSLGGLCGINREGKITDCYATGEITGKYYLGGFCGKNEEGTIINCYTIGNVNCEDDYNSSGFCGGGYGTIDNCYFYLFGGLDNGIGIPLDDLQIQDANSFVGFDFVGDLNDGHWAIVSGHCPKLAWQSDDGPLLIPNPPEANLPGSGNSYDPFQINSYADFLEFKDNNSLRVGYYILNTDIDLSGENFTKAVIDGDFAGHFDGNGHVIRNITIDTEGADSDYLGLFSCIIAASASVSNLGIENISISSGGGSRYLGGLCGSNGKMGGFTIFYGGKINNCYVTGSLNGFKNLGGLCGDNNRGIINNCSASVTVTGQDSSNYLGGICGANSGYITDCYSTGLITSGIDSEYIGGLCGRNSRGTITNCYAIVDVISKDSSSYLGGFCGHNNDGIISNCYFHLLSGPDNNLGITLDGLQMQDANSFIGFDFADNPDDGNNDDWAIIEGHCPRLTWQTNNGPLPPLLPETILLGSGYSYDPFQINNIADFAEFRTNTSLRVGYYILNTDIDLSSKIFTTNPINNDFSGSFDGNNHIIRNITIDTGRISNDYLGLFGRIKYASALIENLVIENINIIGPESSNYIGGLCGENQKGAIRNCYVICEIYDCNNSDYLGGLCGYNNQGTIISCDVISSINDEGSSSSIGGLCGHNYQGNIVDSNATNTLKIGSQSKFVGGLCGYNDGGQISSSTCDSLITNDNGSGYYLGGLCGYNNNGGFIGNCCVIGDVVGANNSRNIGGLCGRNNTSCIINNSDANCFVSSGNNSYYLGGLCGGNFGVINNCFAKGLVTGNEDPNVILHGLGGLCGYNSLGSVNNSYATVKVEGRNYSEYIGGLCGSNYKGDIKNCYATGTISSNNNSINIGGLCGSNYDGDVINSYFIGSVNSGDNSNSIGGLLGYNENDIENCYATSPVISGNNSINIGGLCGYNEGNIKKCYTTDLVSGGDGSKNLGGLCGGNNYSSIIAECYTTGDVSGGNNSQNLGGLCGYVKWCSISNCFATGSVSGDRYIGGLFGYNSDDITRSITNCYSTGTVTGNSNIGGLCGYNSSNISNCFWDIEISGIITSQGGTGKTTVEMQTSSTFTDAGWDFVGEEVNGNKDIWDICDGMNYPKLSWQIPLPGDFVCPDGVDLVDFAVLADTWNLAIDEIGYNDRCDLAGDGIIDFDDLAIFVSQWLEGVE